ncbi:MAG: DUF4911 domain-containing protein [Thermodesulfobacteriota bacterium]
MPNIFIKLHKKSQNVLLQSILGTYSHLMWVRTEDPENNLVKITTTDDLYEESINVLKKIRADVEYDFVDTDNEHG